MKELFGSEDKKYELLRKNSDLKNGFYTVLYNDFETVKTGTQDK